MIISPMTLFAAEKCKENDFFGLIPWWHYLDGSRFTNCDITGFRVLPKGEGYPSDVPLVLLAVIDDLLRIAAIVAVAFVLVGAIQMITSQGNPEDTSKARSSIINALIGLAVAIIAAAFVNFLGNSLGTK